MNQTLFSIRDDPTPKIDGTDTSFTIGARDYKGALCVMVKVLENHPADSRVKICEDVVFQTLSSRMGTGGGNTPMVMGNSVNEANKVAEGGDGMMDVSNTVVRRLTPL